MPLTVYFDNGHNSCRACGLIWHAVHLESCPRCNEGSLHAQGIELLEERDEAIRRIKELEQGIEELYVERDNARTIARQLLALVRKLRGDLDSTRGELRVVESMIKMEIS